MENPVPGAGGQTVACGFPGDGDNFAGCIKSAVLGLMETAMLLTADGTIRFVNEAMIKASGFTSSEEFPASYFDLLSPGNDPSKISALKNNLASGRGWKGILWKNLKESERLEVAVSISPFYAPDDDKTPAGFISIERDLTTERRFERQLRQAQKMEAIGTLAGGIAHDFNNILSAILGFTELAMLDAPEESELMESLNEVMTAGKRARDLVKQLLKFSMQEGKEQSPLKIKPIVSESLNLLRSSIPSNVEIKRNMASDSSVLCDPVDLQQVLMDFCSNAAMAMEGTGGILYVEIKDVLVDQSNTPGTKGLAPGSYVALTVSDTGIGMPAGILSRVFEPFFTTRPEGKGSGLGLSVVHGIVIQAGGDITVESEPGKGSVFTAYFPRYDEPAPESKTLEDLPKGSERLMVIDDEAAQITLARRALGALGYSVETFNNPAHALEEFRQRPGYYDAVITDMTMPGMSGVELSKELKAAKSGIPVILVTGYCQMVEDNAAASLGVDAVIAKPTILKTMAETLREVLVKK